MGNQKKKIVAANLVYDDDARWAQVISKAAKCVVQIRSLVSRPFDGQLHGAGVATGFVVDKAIGLVLTNRHVAGTGPARFELAFANDTVEAEQIYVDPIHDFGFLKFDPKQVQFMEFDELELDPLGARKDVQIRVVGSDAGEKLMVLRGTISRVDRNPPECSPVLNSEGKVVALNCGGAVAAASSFFLPLHGVVRALNSLRTTPFVRPPRGSIHCVFRSRPISEALKLGLCSREHEELRMALVRPFEMLVVSSRVIQSVADLAGLRNGDILMKVQGKWLNDFEELERILDANVGKQVSFELKRGPLEVIKVNIQVQDLYPDCILNDFLEFSFAPLHSVSLARAIYSQIPLNCGIFVQFAGHALGESVMMESILTHWNGVKVTTLDDLEREMCKYSHGEKIRVSYFQCQDKSRPQIEIVTMDWVWFPAQRATRSADRFAKWNIRSVVPNNASPTTKQSSVEHDPREAPLKLVRSVSFKHLDGLMDGAPSESLRNALRSVVHVYFRSPALIDGFNITRCDGAGFVVDKAKGLVLTSRRVVLSLLGDVLIGVAAFKIPAKILFLHPCVLYLVVGEHLDDASELPWRNLSNPPSVSSETLVTIVGMTKQSRVFVQRDALRIASRDFRSIPTPYTPRFAAKNIEILQFERPIIERCVGGVLLKRYGENDFTVYGFTLPMLLKTNDDEDYVELMSSPEDEFYSGLEFVRAKSDVEIALKQGIFSLVCETQAIDLSQATSGFGLSPRTAETIAKAFDHARHLELNGRRSVLQITNIMARSPVKQVLQIGDIFLFVESKPVLKFSEIEQAAHRVGSNGENLKMRILRDRKEHDMEVPLVELSVLGTSRVLTIGGLQMQPAPLAAKMHGYSPFAHGEGEGAYISCVKTGSPAEKSKMLPVQWVVEMNGFPIKDLEDVAKLVREKRIKDGQAIRFRTLDWQGLESVSTLTMDVEMWPTIDQIYDEGKQEWMLHVID